jgi:type IX secretion system PorP/SprF family membrane protein
MQRKLFILSFILLTTSSAFCQQDPQFTQYMFNPLVLNPAYAGSREALSAVLLYRNQWTGFNGAPVTQSASINSPLKNQKIGLGLHIINDRIGPKTSTGYLASYAYRMPLSKGKLSLGLRAGLYNYYTDWSKIDLKDKTDVPTADFQPQKTVPTFDFGIYYYSSTFYIGGCTSHLDQSAYTPDLGDDGLKAKLVSHFTGTIGKAFILSEGVLFKPSMVLKSVVNGPGTADLNLNLLIDNKIWFGAGIRSGYGIMLLTEYNITDKLRMGYSFDISLNRLSSTSTGSHEIFIGYDFDLSKTKTLSPRYF